MVTIWTGVSPGDRSPIRVCSEKLSKLLREPGPWMEEREVHGMARLGYGQSPGSYGQR